MKPKNGPKGPQASQAIPKPDAQKKARLALALKQNLMRRKQAVRKITPSA